MPSATDSSAGPETLPGAPATYEPTVLEPFPPEDEPPVATRRLPRLALTIGAVLALVLCIVVIAVVLTGRHQREEQSRQALRDALAVDAQYQAKNAALEQRFAQISFEPYLLPGALVTREGVTGGVVTLRRYRALLAERNSLVTAYAADVGRVVEAIPAGSLQEGAGEGLAPGLEIARQMNAMLEPTQRAHADAIEGLLDWANANQGWFVERDGRFEFQTPKQQTELVALAQKLDAASQRVLARAAEAEAWRARAAGPHQLALDKAAKPLSH
jgi:hypothetical protein